MVKLSTLQLSVTPYPDVWLVSYEPMHITGCGETEEEARADFYLVMKEMKANFIEVPDDKLLPRAKAVKDFFMNLEIDI